MKLRIVLFSMVLGCGPKVEPIRTSEAARMQLEEARQPDSPLARQANFNLVLRTPEGGGSAVGGIIIHLPDRVRLELRTPVYTPLLSLASDGSAVRVWVPYSGLFLDGDDALEVLEEATAGTIGIRDLLLLLTGRLPLEEAEVISVGWDEGLVDVRFVLADDFVAELWLDPDTQVPSRLEVRHTLDGMTTQILRVDIPDTMRVGRERLPRELNVDLPVLGWELEFHVESWDELGVIPDVFSLTAPSDANHADLVGTIRRYLENEPERPPE